MRLARGLATRAQIGKVLAHHAGQPGSRRLALVLGSGTAVLTRSEAEERLLRLIRRGRLDEPETNVVVAGYEVDFLWRTERLVVEVDGFAFHGSREAFERDRRRDADLAGAGYHVVRVTWQQVQKEPEAVLVRLAKTLARTA